MTLILVLITCGVSIIAFSNGNLFAKWQFNPYQVRHRKEWHRMITHGLLHADWMHLIINMLVLYSFGKHIEIYFEQMSAVTWMKTPTLCFLFLYLSSLAVSSISTLRRHKDDPWYNSVGASGAVSAVLFCCIFFAPLQTIYFYAVIPVNSILFGVLYLIYSYYAGRKNADNINHDAHLWGAVYGFVFPMLIDVRMIQWFIGQF